MTIADRLPATSHRVELHTSPELNEAIRQRADAEIVRLEGAPAAEIDQRLIETAGASGVVIPYAHVAIAARGLTLGHLDQVLPHDRIAHACLASSGRRGFAMRH